MRNFKDIYNRKSAESDELSYSPTVIDHFQHPRNIGVLDDYNAYAKSGDPECGDYVEMFFLIREPDGVIENVSFRVFGCAGAIACGSAVTVLAQGMDMLEALTLSENDVLTYLGGLPENKRHCSITALTALKTALSEYLMRTYAVNEGIVTDEDEFYQTYVQDHPLSNRVYNRHEKKR
ncbi:MAG: iron-sulfur cluster assembly scaffold protein [Deltaproteobacteria bacterium]|nr:iron-sulfur cluster assembly scaffold protein [Candidatus Zymogenaceae bacterium]